MSDAPLPEITRKIDAVEPLDIQHDTDPEHDHGLARRIPHLGHTALFFFLTGFGVVFCVIVALIAVHGLANAPEHPFAAVLGQTGGYLGALAIAIPVFPLLWTVSFWQGIHWTPRQARLHWWQLLLAGVALSLFAQVGQHFFHSTVETDILKLFKTPLSAWVTVIAGTFVWTTFEEIAFRGFFLTSIAIAYDWLALDRTPAGLDRWTRSTAISPAAWTFGAVISSIAFAAIHGFQLHGSKGPLLILFAVSLVFSFVRIRLRSVAASTLVHMAYDGLIFVEMIIGTSGFRHLDKLH